MYDALSYSCTIISALLAYLRALAKKTHLEPLLQAAVEPLDRKDALQLLGCQYLYCCTSKASKLSTCVAAHR